MDVAGAIIGARCLASWIRRWRMQRYVKTLRWGRSLVVTGFLVGVAAACNFSPTAPFSGFDNKGSRVTGRFGSEGDSAAQFNAMAMADSAAKGIRVSIQGLPSISVEVG